MWGSPVGRHSGSCARSRCDRACRRPRGRSRARRCSAARSSTSAASSTTRISTSATSSTTRSSTMPRLGPYGPQPLNWRPPAGMPFNNDDEGPRPSAMRRPAAAPPAAADSSDAETSSTRWTRRLADAVDAHAASSTVRRNMPRLTPRPRDLQAARAAEAREQREAAERHNQYIRAMCVTVCAPAAACENAQLAAATARAVAAARPAPNPTIVIGEYIAPAERGPSDAPYVPPPSYQDLRARFM